MTAGRFLSTIFVCALASAVGCDAGGGSSSAAAPLVQQAGSTRVEYTAESARVVAPRGAVAVSTRSISIGDVTLFDATSAAAAGPEAAATDHVVYRRAPGLEEHFLGAGENVEQRWVLDASLEPHRTAGDLRVAVRLETDLDVRLSDPQAGPPAVLLVGPGGDVVLQ
ncbi:MAG TPA: hypothetical protein VEJ18_10235, partial [Planctomycetota bacterium]|nr:hypothetical protein [Planctomycetota bacterium]